MYMCFTARVCNRMCMYICFTARVCNRMCMYICFTARVCNHMCRLPKVTWGALIHIYIYTYIYTYLYIYTCIQALLAFSPWSVVRTSAEQWIVDMPRGILSFLLNIYVCVCTCIYIYIYTSNTSTHIHAPRYSLILVSC